MYIHWNTFEVNYLESHYPYQWGNLIKDFSNTNEMRGKKEATKGKKSFNSVHKNLLKWKP